MKLMKNVKPSTPAPGTPPTSFPAPRPGQSTPAPIVWVEMAAAAAKTRKERGR